MSIAVDAQLCDQAGMKLNGHTFNNDDVTLLKVLDQGSYVIGTRTHL